MFTTELVAPPPVAMTPPWRESVSRDVGLKSERNPACEECQPSAAAAPPGKAELLTLKYRANTRYAPTDPASPPYCTNPAAVSRDPPPAVTRPPFVSAELFVMILMTPLTAFAPHTVPPGPRMISIRSISSRGTSTWSQKTPEKLST